MLCCTVLHDNSSVVPLTNLTSLLTILYEQADEETGTKAQASQQPNQSPTKSPSVESTAAANAAAESAPAEPAGDVPASSSCKDQSAPACNAIVPYKAAAGKSTADSLPKGSPDDESTAAAAAAGAGAGGSGSDGSKELGLVDSTEQRGEVEADLSAANSSATAPVSPRSPPTAAAASDAGGDGARCCC
jgi:hypothetical protein